MNGVQTEGLVVAGEVIRSHTMKDPNEQCWDFVITKATGSSYILSRGKGLVVQSALEGGKPGSSVIGG